MRSIRHMTEAQWVELEAYYEAGNGFVACGRKFDINWQTVRNHLRRRGNVQIKPSRAAEYWKQREIIREVIVEVPKEVIVEVEKEPEPEPSAPPTPTRRIVSVTSNTSRKYEG